LSSIKINHQILTVSKFSPKKRSRQQRGFLLLELLIALCLVGTYALPLAHFPIQAIQEEVKSVYRMEVQRLADLAFAEFKEKLYRQEISWEEIASASKVKIMDDSVTVSLEPVGTKEFKRSATVSSVGKKGKQGEEWRLATFRVKFEPTKSRLKLFRGKNKNKASCTFVYQVLLEKKPNLPSAPVQENPPKQIQTG
jgi:Tfp pilus assembly protein PilE